MTIALDGVVTSGLGTGAEFVSMDGYAEQFQGKLGYDPYPGTLNLDVDVDVHERLAGFDAILIEGWEDGDRSFGGVDCYPASLPESDESVAVHAIVPRRSDHDASTVELVSPVHLREALDLEDGSRLSVEITEP